MSNIYVSKLNFAIDQNATGKKHINDYFYRLKRGVTYCCIFISYQDFLFRFYIVLLKCLIYILCLFILVVYYFYLNESILFTVYIFVKCILLTMMHSQMMVYTYVCLLETNQEVCSTIFQISLRILEISSNSDIIGSVSSLLSLCVSNNSK